MMRVLEQCMRTLIDAPSLIAATHTLAFLAGVGTYAVYRRVKELEQSWRS